ncbi:unnamed protein product [Cochlearia groenlandica]
MTAKGQWLGPQLGTEQVRTEGSGGERPARNAAHVVTSDKHVKDPSSSKELETYKKGYSELVIRDIHEIARLRRSRSEYVEALEIRLGRLKDYLNDEENVMINFLLRNQLKGIFDALKQLEGKYALTPPTEFTENLRDKEKKLVD